jgi:hypothetical protein
MATNPPSTVKVTIGQNNPTVTSIGYGSRTLKSATDLSISGAVDGYPIIYQANTNSFILGPVAIDAGVIDSGFF